MFLYYAVIKIYIFTVQHLISFEWFCRREGEQFPVNPITGEFLRFPLLKEKDAKKAKFDAGGCYGEGIAHHILIYLKYSHSL